MKIVLALFSYGNIEPRVMDAVMGEIDIAAAKQHVIYYTRIHDDALISRSRSKAMSDFLSTDADVLFMLDHDVEHEPGMIWETCEQAAARQCMFGGMYSMRARGRGIAGRLAKHDARVHPGADERHDAEYLPGGFLAIPRVVLEEILKNGGAEQKDPNLRVTECIGLDGKSRFWDFARCVTVPSTIVSGLHEYESEDWVICYRARAANKVRPQYLWAKPMLLHWGFYGYNLLEAGQATPPASKIVR